MPWYSSSGPDGSKMTPARFAALCGGWNDQNRGEARAFLPPMSRIVRERSWDAPELRLGIEFAPKYRFLYGYIGLIERLKDDKKST